MIIGISGMTEDPQGTKGSANSGKDTVADHLVKEYGFVKVALADPMKRFCMELFDFTEEQLWGGSEKRNAPDKRYPRGYRLDCGCLADAWNRTNDISTNWWVFAILEPCEEHRAQPGWHKGKLFPDPPPAELEYLTPRYALQQLGTEWGRDCYTDVWANYAMRVAKKILTPFEPNHEIVKEGWRCYTQAEGFNNLFDLKQPGGVVISDLRYPNENNAIVSTDIPGVRVRIKRPVSDVLKEGAGEHTSETSLIHMHDDGWDWVINNDGTEHVLKMKVDQLMARLSGRIAPYDEKNGDTPPFKRA